MRYFAIALAFMAVGCIKAPPKILVAHDFLTAEKTSKTLLQDSGQINPATKQRIFDVLVRVCNVSPDGTEKDCKDTKVVDNVVPGSVY